MDYMSALSAVMPKGIIPDTGTDDSPNVSNIPGTADASGSTSFKDYVIKQMSDVNDKINTSDANTRDLATGVTDDIDKVTTSVEEANLALQHMMAIRTKLLDAYSEISRLQV
jgi:flagellar hook-basal body complex protein FliE